MFLRRGDQCLFGQRPQIGTETNTCLNPPVGYVSNSLSIVSKVAVRCPNHYLEPGMPGRHGHVQLLNGKAKAFQAYPPRLERAIIDGPVEQLTSDRILKAGFVGVLAPEEDLHEQLPATPWNEGADVSAQEREDIFIDDVSGCRLDPVTVRQARAEEPQEVHRFGVYVEAPIEEAIRVASQGGSPSVADSLT